MKVLITGGNGFIGKNLRERLSRIPEVEILNFTKEESEKRLKKLIEEADFIFHLAGINRPQNKKEFYLGNRDLTKKLVDILKEMNKKTPILFTSSIQVNNDNDYGKSKLEAENILKEYAKNAEVYNYRLPNVFGKWSKPNYNSVIATWCYNISRNIPIFIDDPKKNLNLVYIDDVVEYFVRHLFENRRKGFIKEKIAPTYKKSLGEIKNLLEDFKKSRETLLIPKVGVGFERALYATYLSFLPQDEFSYPVKGYSDERGIFYELIKTIDSGQFSISTTKPGDIIRGNHYHNTKNEKFIVVKGEALIQLREIYSENVIEYKVSSDKIEVVEMIPGYTHNIKNISNEELILIIWANEIYDPTNPDTYSLKV